MNNPVWRLGEDLARADSLLDGFTFGQVIDALRTYKDVNERSAREALNLMLEIQMQDMEYLFEQNLDVIIEMALEGRGQ